VTGKCEWVEVACPQCGNLNRKARRACRYCQHTGKVLKSVPVSAFDEVAALSAEALRGLAEAASRSAREALE
jgi:uncharacterized OB-fold protein